MSSFPSRQVEVWQSSRAETLGAIEGAFVFHLTPSLMVPQTLQFLRELSATPMPGESMVSSFVNGMAYAPADNQDSLYFWKRFTSAKELFSFGFGSLSDAIRQLELHLDINLTFNRITYLAVLGRGPELPLLIFSRVPYARGVAFTVTERGHASESLRLGDLPLSDKAKVAQQHFSTGMALLAGEDAVAGLIDAAFMQFYLAIESILESHESAEAAKNGPRLFGPGFTADLAAVVQHVYLARHRFFGHAHPKYLAALQESDTAFAIAKQTLVARWCARTLLSLEVKQPLLHRETRLYGQARGSVGFSGNRSQLNAEFQLPK